VLVLRNVQWLLRNTPKKSPCHSGYIMIMRSHYFTESKVEERNAKKLK